MEFETQKQDMKDIKQLVEEITKSIQKVIVGKSDTIELLIISMICRGHILLEDVPGIGKTTLAKSLAQSLGSSFSRIQCTPDLMPNDVAKGLVSIFVKLICKFLGINFDKKMLKIKQITSSHISDGVKTGFVRDNISTWKNKLSKTEIWINQKINSLLMEKLNYKKIDIYPNILHLLFIILYFPIHIILMIIINFKNVLSVFKKK